MSVITLESNLNTGLATLSLDAVTKSGSDTAYTGMTFSGIVNNQVGITALGGNSFNLQAGAYIINLDASVTSTNSRWNCQTRMTVGGLPVFEKHNSAYMRVAEGHNEAGISHTISFVLITTETFELDWAGIAGGNGIATIVTARSFLNIQKLN